ncbi:ATP-binding protein [Carnobacterium gallinarum]|uniref:ATP-binding protein n=1 Tax=Carnobacterium gallinarum TaxID=2749 RepID=UPI00068B66BB|nr:ATP-binding protein [Carnobacterium gallinarum]
MESLNTEYKEEMPEPKNMKAEIISFLNSPTGGHIYLGVNDNGKPVKFATDELRIEKYKEWARLLNHWISNAFKPNIAGLIFVNPDAEIFTISIRSGLNKPYYYMDEEKLNNKDLYIRQDHSNRLASDIDVTRIRQTPLMNSFDSELITQSDLAFSYAQLTFDSLNKEFDIIDLEFKKHLRGTFNNAALIVSDANPHTAKLAVYKGLDALSFKNKEQFEESIAKQIDEVIHSIHLNNKMKVTIGSTGKRIEYYSYPEEAIREAVVNAFVHKDYTLASDIKIEIYDDRLAISSPGSLPSGLTADDVKQGAHAKRNPLIMNALDQMGYIENEGSGIRRIYSLYKGFARQPDLIATHNLVTVILYNRNYRLNTVVFNNNTLIEIIDYLSDGKFASIEDIQEALTLQESYTIELITSLRKKGLIESEAQDSTPKYYLKHRS